MSRQQSWLIGMLLAVLLVGPLVYLAQFVLRIGLGMVGTQGLSNPAFALWVLGRLLMRGMRIGLIGGLAAVACRFEPRFSALVAAGVGLVFRSAETLYLALEGRIVPGYLVVAVVQTFMDAAAISLTAYLTAVWMIACQRRYPRTDNPAPKTPAPGQRLRL